MRFLVKKILPIFLLIGSISTASAEIFTGHIQTINVGNDFLFITYITTPDNQFKLGAAWATGTNSSKNFDSLVTLLSDAYQANSKVRIETDQNGFIWLVDPFNQ